jgi:hypothetical protein
VKTPAEKKLQKSICTSSATAFHVFACFKYPSQDANLHIHCPRCDTIIKAFPLKSRNLIRLDSEYAPVSKKPT